MSPDTENIIKTTPISRNVNYFGIAFLVFDHAKFINCNGNMVIFFLIDSYYISLICFLYVNKIKKKKTITIVILKHIPHIHNHE